MAGEDVTSIQQRKSVEKEVESLTEARRILTCSEVSHKHSQRAVDADSNVGILEPVEAGTGIVIGIFPM